MRHFSRHIIFGAGTLQITSVDPKFDGPRRAPACGRRLGVQAPRGLVREVLTRGVLVQGVARGLQKGARRVDLGPTELPRDRKATAVKCTSLL